MKNFPSTLTHLQLIGGNLSRSVSYFLGLMVLGLAATLILTDRSIVEIISWAENILGYSFIGLLVFLVAGSLFCLVNMNNHKDNAKRHLWLEAGSHMTGGITTLALTFTLLGISLGIGGLAEQTLTPETVQDVIRDLTAQFSLAFMTTVIGLPLSAVLRGILLINHAFLVSKES